MNVVEKGKEGERQVARALNAVIENVLTTQSWTQDVILSARSCVQRNQNQSAVGGCDLTNVFGLSIEIKRQEQLSIDAWWRQTVESAIRNKEMPVLIYRQNHGKWRVVMYLQNPLPLSANRPPSKTIRAEFGWEDFLEWFHMWVYHKLLNGNLPRG